jgi:hypothetical protein
MPSPTRESRNPLYLLLLVVGVVFVMTALAYAIIPVVEQKATDAGHPPPPSAFRDALREHGGTWLLVQVAVLIVLSLASMAWDHLRGLQKRAPERTIPEDVPSTLHTVAHEHPQNQPGRDLAGPEDR